MKHVEAFTSKGATMRSQYDWCARAVDGTGVITVWNQVDTGTGASEVVYNKDTKRSRLLIRVQEGERDWTQEPRAKPYLAMCAEAWKSDKPLLVLLRDGDRSKDKARTTYDHPNLYAVRVDYVGEGADAGTVTGDFMTKAEFEQ